jgi:hypothetical protein
MPNHEDCYDECECYERGNDDGWENGYRTKDEEWDGELEDIKEKHKLFLNELKRAFDNFDFEMTTKPREVITTEHNEIRMEFIQKIRQLLEIN